MAFAAGRYAFPRRNRRRPRRRRGRRLDGTQCRRVGSFAVMRRIRGAGTRLCRDPRDLRGVRRAAGRTGRGECRGRHDRSGLGKRPGSADRSSLVVHRLSHRPRACAAYRSARPLGALDNPGVRATADTTHRFFLAVLPTAQRTRDVSGEADKVVWMRPGDAVRAVDDASMDIAATEPTVTLRELSPPTPLPPTRWPPRPTASSRRSLRRSRSSTGRQGSSTWESTRVTHLTPGP